jgi:transcriptional regulator with XRE-family HTH domain
VTAGEALAVARDMRGWSQTDLGKALGLSFAQVSRYETHTRRVPAVMLEKAAVALDVRFECDAGGWHILAE